MRTEKSQLIFDNLEAWLHAQLPGYPANYLWRKPSAMLSAGCQKAQPYLKSGFLEFENNSAERAMNPVALGCENWMFAGSQRGGKAMAIAFTLIETAKLNDVDPQVWFTDVLSRIADHKIDRLDEPMPWNYNSAKRNRRLPQLLA